MSLETARQAISSAHRAWSKGALSDALALADAAWEAADRAAACGDSALDVGSVKTLTAHFVMHAIAPDAPGAEPREFVDRLRASYERVSTWFENEAFAGNITDARTGHTVDPVAFGTEVAVELRRLGGAP